MLYALCGIDLVVFLMPWLQRDFTLASLWACILIHACLVVFRTASFFMYDDISSMTYKLAVGEWIILLSGLGVWYWLSQHGTQISSQIINGTP